MSLRFDLETDRPLVRKESRTRYVLAHIVAPAGTPRQRPPVNLALVLDRSGSMAGEKIRLAKEAAVDALNRLESRDRVAVVFYDSRIDVVVPSAPATRETKDVALRAIRDVEPRASTDLCGGWMRGCEQVALVDTPDAVRRVILLTDGLANAGITDASEIIGHASELRRRHIATTTIGVGDDFDEHLLGGMADAGGGNSYYVRHAEEIAGKMQIEVGEALEVTLREAWLRVGPASLAEVTPIAPYRTRRAGDDWVIELGDLVSSQEVALPLRIAFLPTALTDVGKPAVGLTFALGSGSAPAGAEAVVQWRVASPAEVSAQVRNRGVDRAVAEAYAALAVREAGRLNRAGDYHAARERLARTRARISSYAGDDSVLNDVMTRLERDAREHAVAMPASALKSSYAVSRSVLVSRSPSGEARRAAPDEDESQR